MPTTRSALTITALSLALTSCGTNLPWLIAEDSRLVAEADHAVSTAETLGTGLEQPVYAAEATKSEACKFIYDEVSERLGRKPRFAEQFRSDLSTLFVLLVPVNDVERCAQAFDAYRASVIALEHRLAALGDVPASADETTP
jgi:hypothetical protein